MLLRRLRILTERDIVEIRELREAIRVIDKEILELKRLKHEFEKSLLFYENRVKSSRKTTPLEIYFCASCSMPFELCICNACLKP